MADHLLASVERYYSGKLREHGATHAGVDWNSRDSQELRFEQLLRAVARPAEASILDYGCGYGALAGWLGARGLGRTYQGYDISSAMVAAAREAYPGTSFTTDAHELEPADAVVASGIFNVTAGATEDAWREHVRATVERLARLARRVLAFNMLTTYSDAGKRRADLFYAEPCEWFDLCKRELSPHVALLHDYGLYEFTLIVTKEEG